MNSNFHIRKAVVPRPGVVCAQIAAHLLNANVGTLLFGLPVVGGHHLTGVCLTCMPINIASRQERWQQVFRYEPE